MLRDTNFDHYNNFARAAEIKAQMKAEAKVAAAFDRQVLKRICEMPEEDFAKAYGLERVAAPQRGYEDDFYNFRDHGSKVLAVAHLDTVSPDYQRTANFIDTASGPVIYSRALDDRLGAYVILELLPALGIQFDILLTVGEEEGRSTASMFDAPKDYNWMIEFDRGGTDVVLYQYENREMVDLVRDSGARVGNGSFSDISYLEHLGTKGFNWGVGYQDYHGPRSHAYLEDLFKMVAHFLKFHEANAETPLPHEEEDPWWTRRSWGRYGGFGLSSSNGWADDDFTDLEVGETTRVEDDPDQEEERECDVEFGEHEHDEECAKILAAMKIGVGEPLDEHVDEIEGLSAAG